MQVTSRALRKVNFLLTILVRVNILPAAESQCEIDRGRNEEAGTEPRASGAGSWVAAGATPAAQRLSERLLLQRPFYREFNRLACACVTHGRFGASRAGRRRSDAAELHCRVRAGLARSVVAAARITLTMRFAGIAKIAPLRRSGAPPVHFHHRRRPLPARACSRSLRACPAGCDEQDIETAC